LFWGMFTPAIRAIFLRINLAFYIRRCSKVNA
jgi:hypothetical protein